ncbi:MAG: ABC transporter permease, partial [Chloroflexi bacterium]|nr:ABC transporter permease [Chloroflexota bacterium]
LLGDSVDMARRRAIDTAFDARVGWPGPERLVEERTQRLLLDFAEPSAVGSSGETVTHQPWNAFLFWLSGFERNMTVTEGRLPGSPDQGPEVLLLDGFQRHAALGDTITLRLPGFDDCENIPPSDDPSVARFEVRCQPTTAISQTVEVTVVGFVRPNDPTDQRWQLFDGSFEVPEEAYLPHVDAAEDDPLAAEALAGKGSMPLLTSEEQLFGAFGVVTPHIPLRHRVALVADLRALSLGDVGRGIDAPRQLRSDLSDRLDLLALVRFPVGDTLSEFRNTQTFQQVPLLIILLQVVGIVVYYVAVVASMLVERQAEEISVYRSRGASTAQLVGLYLMEGVFMAAIAAAVGPWIAGQAVAALGYTPTFSLMTNGGALPAAITPEAYLLAAGGAALALLALLLPAFAVARSGIVDTKREQSRPPGRSLIQRYYLDFGAVVLAGILLWQLGQRGTVFDPDAVGGWSSDPLLLLSPFVFTLAVAALVLRFYPPLLRWAVALLLTVGGTSVALGLRRAARAPAAYARLLLLLMMAIAVGTFAASYGATVERSQTDRIRYATGTDIRAPIQDLEQLSALDRVVELRAVDGVDDAALAFRGSLTTPSVASLQLLALDPQRAASMLWFRDDFADESLRQLMLRLQSDVPSGGGVELDERTQAIHLSVFATTPRQQSTLWARFRTARGR